MGYFNIFYKITRIIDFITKKRNRKAIMVIVIIIAAIVLWNNTSRAAQEDTTYTTDTSYFIIEEYNKLCDTFKLSFDKYYSKDETVTSRFNTIFESIINGNFPYFYSINYNTNIRIYMYTRNQNKTYIDTSLVYNDGTRVPSTAYNFTWLSGNRYYYINLGYGDTLYRIYETTDASDVNFTIPFILMYKIPTQVYECMEKAGYTYQNNQDVLDIKALLQEQNNKLDVINDSLTNTTYNEDIINVDSSVVDSVPETQVNGVFTQLLGTLQTEFNKYGGEKVIVQIPIPFTSSRLELPSDLVSSHLPDTFISLIHAFWYYVFGLYLFRFVNNLIKKIHSGEILDGYSNDNEVITANML